MPCATFPAIVKCSFTSHTFRLIINVLPLDAFDPAALYEVKVIACVTRIVHVEDAIRVIEGVLHFAAKSH